MVFHTIKENPLRYYEKQYYNWNNDAGLAIADGKHYLAGNGWQMVCG